MGCGVVWCGVVWCGVVWCGVVWCGVVWCGVVLWCGVVWCGVVWCGVVWCGVVWCGVVWCGAVWCGVVWCGVVWCGVVCGAVEGILLCGCAQGMQGIFVALFVLQGMLLCCKEDHVLLHFTPQFVYQLLQCTHGFSKHVFAMHALHL